MPDVIGDVESGDGRLAAVEAHFARAALLMPPTFLLDREQLEAFVIIACTAMHTSRSAFSTAWT